MKFTEFVQVLIVSLNNVIFGVILKNNIIATIIVVCIFIGCHWSTVHII